MPGNRLCFCSGSTVTTLLPGSLKIDPWGQWLDRIDRAKIDLGKGKRMIAKGGKLDPKYQITVPEEMDALQ